MVNSEFSMKKLAIAIIHGLGSEEEFYSVELKHRICEQYLTLGKNRNEDDLVFHEIYWGDLVKDELNNFRTLANYKSDLTYQKLRQIMTDTQVLALLYSPGRALYDAINTRIKDELRKFSTHRNIDSSSTPLVILAHSYGGVMMTHYIEQMQQLSSERSHFESMKTLTGYVTFGNPMGTYLVNSDDLILGKPCNITGELLDDKLKSKARWYNFYDKDDIIAYPLKGLSDEFNAAVYADIEINVGTAVTSWNPGCHTGYWEDKDFYRPVAKFISDLCDD